MVAASAEIMGTVMPVGTAVAVITAVAIHREFVMGTQAMATVPTMVGISSVVLYLVRC
jgi:hypothetical protein